MNYREGLIKRRSQLGFTHDIVAQKANISRAYYTNIEIGRKDPSMKVMKSIASAMDSTVGEIFFDHEVPKRNKIKQSTA